MSRDELRALRPSLRYMAASCIALGGCMHAVGLLVAAGGQMSHPWWFWGIYGVAIIGYPACAVLILGDRKTGYYLTALGPTLGGLLILLGFLFPGSGLLVLIPGTQTTEITLTGFLTLISEPVAVVLALVLLALGTGRQGPRRQPGGKE